MGLKDLIPARIRRALWRIYSGTLDVQTNEDSNRIRGLGWFFQPSGVISRFRMRRYQNLHLGKRCFIVGNGPSLNQMDLQLLRNEITFGANRIYLIFPKIGFQTTYYVSVNRLVIAQCSKDIENLQMPKFISWYARNDISFKTDITFVRDPHDRELGFSKIPVWHVCEGATVTYVAMQLAYYMGFKQVILIGVDHSYATTGQPHKTVLSAGKDPNHFDPNYFGRGFRWQLPDLETSERAYGLAKINFEQDNREILDATIAGKLDIFPKVDYQALFDDKYREVS
jgi:hypothetical protein